MKQQKKYEAKYCNLIFIILSVFPFFPLKKEIIIICKKEMASDLFGNSRAIQSTKIPI